MCATRAADPPPTRMQSELPSVAPVGEVVSIRIAPVKKCRLLHLGGAATRKSDRDRAVMAVNVRGSFLACKYALPQMNDGGSVIITSSIMGVKANGNIAGYATSKHALIGLVRCVAKEVAPRGIRVNVLAPGPVENAFQSDIEQRLYALGGSDATEMINRHIPLARHGKPEKIAKSVLFLASEASSFSIGGVFMADGGMNS